MAFSNPQVYLEELAEPLCRRFDAEPTSYELAIASCIILYHYADVIAHVRKQKVHHICVEIADKVPSFDTIRAIANAGKHVELTRHPNGALVGLRAEHLTLGRGAAFSDGSYWAGGVSWSDAPETVIVETPDGTKHDVLHTCNSVLNSLLRLKKYFEV